MHICSDNFFDNGTGSGVCTASILACDLNLFLIEAYVESCGIYIRLGEFTRIIYHQSVFGRGGESRVCSFTLMYLALLGRVTFRVNLLN